MTEPMTHEAAPITVVQRRNVPETIRALGSLAKLDYVDLFVATTSEATDASPEQWARAAMERASPAGRFIAWRLLCGLHLEPRRSPEYVAGWKIADRGDNWIRVEASSSFMSARMVFLIDERRASFATFVRYDRPIGALIWGCVSVIHRAIAPDFLRAAVKRVERS
jgi:hypothetical protein